MSKKSLFFRSLSLLLALAVASLSMPPAPVLAAMVTTDQVLAGAAAEQGDRARLRALLAREDIREELRDMGLAPGEAAARVDAMSDGEVALLVGQMDSLAAGQAGAEGVLYWGAILVLLLIILALVV
jgi:hypothetical protein